MDAPMADQFMKSHARLSRLLGRSFPDASEQEVEDALSDAFEVVYSRPTSAVGSVTGLLYTIAWRRLRGVFRRHARRFNQSITTVDEPTLRSEAPQDIMLSASRWVLHFEATILEHGKTQADPLRRALLDKMETGDPDGVVAERHGLTRARLNRAWNLLLERLLEG
jgi:DNA-directed RNA polymerase specialized sigma24 family protein